MRSPAGPGPRLICSLVAALALAPLAAAADGEFLQYDLTPDDSSLSASLTRGDYGAGLVHSRFTDGSETTLSASRAFAFTALGAGATVKIGPSVQEADGDLALGVKLSAEQYRGMGWGGLFLLGEVNSVNAGYFAMAQANPGYGRYTVEATASGNDGGYRERALALGVKLGDSPVRARVGYRFLAETAFVGISVNTY